MKVLHKTLLLTLAVAAASPAFAYDAGNVIVRGGIAQVSPDVSTDANTTGLDVDSNVQLGLTATYMVSPKFGVEVLAATPFEHDITAGGTTIGTTKHLPPTVTAQWFPLDSASKVQPYLGLGLNYTTFFSEELNATGKAATGANSLSLSDSFGLAVEAGVDVQLTDNIVLNAAVWKIDINTDVSLDGSKVGEVQLDPLAAMIGVGYKF